MSPRQFYGLAILAVIVAAIDLGHTFHLGYHKHMSFDTPEVWVNFYGFYGLIAALIVVIGGLILRSFLRPSDQGDA